MPEGHTTRRLARQHQHCYGGSPVKVSSPQGRFAKAAQVLDRRVLKRAKAHGKHLLHMYDADLVVHVHLGLYGSYRGDVAGAAAPWPGTHAAHRRHPLDRSSRTHRFGESSLSLRSLRVSTAAASTETASTPDRKHVETSALAEGAPARAVSQVRSVLGGWLARGGCRRRCYRCIGGFCGRTRLRR